MLWNGETLSAYAIGKALEWSYINDEDISNMAAKIVVYFSGIRRGLYHKQKAQNKNISKRK